MTSQSVACKSHIHTILDQVVKHCSGAAYLGGFLWFQLFALEVDLSHGFLFLLFLKFPNMLMSTLACRHPIRQHVPYRPHPRPEGADHGASSPISVLIDGSYSSTHGMPFCMFVFWSSGSDVPLLQQRVHQFWVMCP